MEREKRTNSIMVCVTGQRTCDQLITRGVERAGANPACPGMVHVVHCVETGRNFMNTPYESDAIEYLFTAAQIAGADLSLLRAKDVEDALVEFAVSRKADILIMGSGGRAGGGKEPLAIRLQRRLPQVEFDIIAPQ